MRPPVSGNPPRPMVAVGILMLATGRAGGLRHFGDTSRAVLQALAPLAAFMLVGIILVLVTGRGQLSDLLGVAIGFLGQLVFSFEIARRWGRAAEWYRFAAAFCWCQWAGPLAMAALMLVTALLLTAGAPRDATALTAVVLLFGYGIWLHWFLARSALGLTRLRALALVLVVNTATTVLVFVPQIAGGTTYEQPANGSDA